MPARDQALKALRWNWGDAFELGEDDEHGWRAERRDGIGGLITAADPGELDVLVDTDYGLMPVSRDYGPGER
jgi:hypothetical protein